MGMTMTQKILAAHAGLNEVTAGQLITCKLDLVHGNDITTPVAVNVFKNFGLSVYDNANVKIYENDPIMLTTLGFKYLYGKTDYYQDIGDNVYQNPNFLGMGYMVNESIYKYKFVDNYYDRKNFIEENYGYTNITEVNGKPNVDVLAKLNRVLWNRKFKNLA